MNCQEYWNTMPELAEGGGYAGDHPHPAGCSGCRSRLERQRELQAGLGR